MGVKSRTDATQERKMYTMFWSENLKRRDNLEEDGRMMTTMRRRRRRRKSR
jgi:hypothetical protein